MSLPNLFHDIPAVLPAELVEVLYESDRVRIERIISRGHAAGEDSWYDQDRDEFVLLLSGRAELEFEGAPERVFLRAGDYLSIPAHRRHRVAATDPEEDSVWLAVYC